MPSLLEYKTYLSHCSNTIGDAHKKNSDMIMEQTWDRDIQSKKCYIYDYYHDDQPWLNEGMTYNSTSKTPIDAKFIINQQQSMERDRVSVFLQFKPSAKLRFDEGDSLYYYETDYRNKYKCNFPIGLYCDIPDDRGVYHKWIICANEINNQFIKYLILPANYRFTWVDNDGSERIIRRVWGCTRSQNSYNSGLWTDTYITRVENQFKAILPLNPITERLFYVDDERQNQRFIISAMTRTPRTWKVSKYEDMLMGDFGLVRLTFVQEAFDTATDFVDYNATNPDGSKDVYAMYANYFESSVPPKEDTHPLPTSDYCVVSASTDTIKVGGSYKTITAKFYNTDGDDITESYLPDLSINSWTFFIDGIDITSDNIITVLEQSPSNKIKVRFTNDMKYLTKTLEVYCTSNGVIGRADFDITNL